MAPSLPVYSRDEIKKLYPHIFPERSFNENNVTEDGNDDRHINTSTNNSTNGKLILTDIQKNNDCKLYSLTQNQCTFDGNKTICIPFKRVFARCIDRELSKGNEVVGYKLAPMHKRDLNQRSNKQKINNKSQDTFHDSDDHLVYRNVEITDWYDNDYLNSYLNSDNIEKRELMKEFLKADKILQSKMHQYYHEMKDKEK
ncbi:unnamed protein product [[Candida] boidinii]|nr:hypothetical protein B5S30_g5551 [[Candida] boidinii]GMF61260.1 unnamed protein product [[Candida] boidinii]GMF98654.1 unnamed protein product [[Candida] boidinii]